MTMYLYFQTAPPIIARYVPFTAVAAANLVNVPLMRQRYAISWNTCINFMTNSFVV